MRGGGRTTPDPAATTTYAVEATVPVRQDRTGPRPLPPRWHDLLRDGVDIGNRSEAIRSVILSMIAHGWDYADFHREMSNPYNHLGWWFVYRSNGVPRTEQDRHRRLRAEWRKACQYAVEHPSVVNADEARQLIGLWRAEAEAMPWAYRSGLRDRTLLGLLYDVGTERGATHIGVSVRTLCERSPYRSPSTVQRGLGSLARRHVIEQDRRPNPLDCSAYQLLSPDRWVREIGTRTAHGSTSGLRVPLARTSSLGLVQGPHAAAVSAALTEDPLSARQVAGRAGVGSRTADKYLPRLALLGLAVLVDGGWVVGDTPPEVAAVREGAVEVEMARQARHKRDRHNWEQHMQHHWRNQ